MPPLQALRAFEAAGRLLSFRRAGEELLITQSAISHHIKQLEASVGCSFFVRRSKSIELTPEGKRYLARITSSLEDIRLATLEMQFAARPERLRVSLLPSFASNFLLSRIGKFQALHPRVDLEFDPTCSLVDLDRGEADLAIRFGDGTWKNLKSDLLKIETLSPVVSPRLYGSGSELRNASDLLNHTLLFTLKPTEWELWANGAGIDLSKARVMQLNDYNVVLQAALDGHGIAMGRRLLVQAHLDRGQLLQPFDLSVESSRAAHWAVWPRHVHQLPHVEAFREWLRAEMGPDSGR